MTTPSLNPSVNVSGISTVVRGLMSQGLRPGTGFDWHVVPAVVGKRDRQRRGPGWLLSQLLVPVNFASSVFRHRPDIVHVNGPLSTLAVVRDATLILIAHLFGARIIYHVHGGRFVHERPTSYFLHRVIIANLHKPSLIIVLSELEAESVARLYDVDPKRIRVLRNSVELPAACPVKESEGALRVLSIGRLSPEKGLSVLCDAVDRNPGWKDQLELRMYGAGDLQAEITDHLTASLGPAFQFQGVADEEEKAKAYAWADIVVMPSLWGEGLPMVLLEAMAAGVVPIATRDGSIPEVVLTGENGILVEKGSSDSLSRAIFYAMRIKRSGELQRLAQSAFLTVKNTHSLSQQGRELGRIYDEIVP